MQSKLYRVIEGDDILKLSENKADAIVEGMINENDYIMLVAEEKMGKTILAQQLACSLTKGIPFLGTFDIPKPTRVWYFATEGKAEDLKDRFIRMNRGVPMDTSMLKLIPSSFRFNTPEGLKSLSNLIEEYKDELPKVIIIDALYRAIKGSIRNDDIVNEFHHTIAWLIEQCDCAVVLVHHMTKPQRTPTGQYMERSD